MWKEHEERLLATGDGATALATEAGAAAAAADADTKCGKSFRSRDEDFPVATQMAACSPSLPQPIEPSPFLRLCVPKIKLHRAGGKEQMDTQVRVL